MAIFFESVYPQEMRETWFGITRLYIRSESVKKYLIKHIDANTSSGLFSIRVSCSTI